MKVDTDDLVTATDIAERAGVSQAAVWNWLARRESTRFPEPVFTAHRTTLWLWTDVHGWLIASGREETA